MEIDEQRVRAELARVERRLAKLQRGAPARDVEAEASASLRNPTHQENAMNGTQTRDDEQRRNPAVNTFVGSRGTRTTAPDGQLQAPLSRGTLSIVRPMGARSEPFELRRPSGAPPPSEPAVQPSAEAPGAVFPRPSSPMPTLQRPGSTPAGDAVRERSALSAPTRLLDPRSSEFELVRRMENAEGSAAFHNRFGGRRRPERVDAARATADVYRNAINATLSNAGQQLQSVADRSLDAQRNDASQAIEAQRAQSAQALEGLRGQSSLTERREAIAGGLEQANIGARSALDVERVRGQNALGQQQLANIGAQQIQLTRPQVDQRALASLTASLTEKFLGLDAYGTITDEKGNRRAPTAQDREAAVRTAQRVARETLGVGEPRTAPTSTPPQSGQRPTLDAFLGAARQANPGVSDADLEAYWLENYGSP